MNSNKMPNITTELLQRALDLAKQRDILQIELVATERRLADIMIGKPENLVKTTVRQIRHKKIHRQIHSAKADKMTHEEFLFQALKRRGRPMRFCNLCRSAIKLGAKTKCSNPQWPLHRVLAESPKFKQVKRGYWTLA